jgi:hypothetical protein
MDRAQSSQKDKHKKRKVKQEERHMLEKMAKYENSDAL